jgi:hypothetical protein
MTIAARRLAESKAPSAASLNGLEADLAGILLSSDPIAAEIPSLMAWQKAFSLQQSKPHLHG